MPDDTPKKKRGCLIRLARVGLVLLLIGAAAWAVAWWHGRPVISPETTVLTAPLTEDGLVDYAAALDAAWSEGVTPENNTAVALLQIFGPEAIETEVRPATYEKLGIAPLPETGDYYVTLEAFNETESDSDAAPWEIPDAPWTADEHPRIARWLTANAAALNRAVEAVGRERYFFPIDTGESLLSARQTSTYGYSRDLARALVARSLLSAGRG